MSDWLAQLEAWMQADEDEHLELEEAKASFHFETLVDSCTALGNERGGKMILGVTDRRPRRVVGSQAFPDLGRTKAGLTERLHLRIEAWEIAHPDGRVLVFDVPSHRRPDCLQGRVQDAIWREPGRHEELRSSKRAMIGARRARRSERSGASDSR